MIVIAAECRIRQEFWPDFEEQMIQLSPVVREEAGCLRYDILTGIEEPGLFIILEEWESRKHLDDHLATSHMRDHFVKSAHWQSEPVSLTSYTVSASERQTI